MKMLLICVWKKIKMHLLQYYSD